MWVRNSRGGDICGRSSLLTPTWTNLLVLVRTGTLSLKTVSGRSHDHAVHLLQLIILNATVNFKPQSLDVFLNPDSPGSIAIGRQTIILGRDLPVSGPFLTFAAVIDEALGQRRLLSNSLARHPTLVVAARQRVSDRLSRIPPEYWLRPFQLDAACDDF